MFQEGEKMVLVDFYIIHTAVHVQFFLDKGQVKMKNSGENNQSQANMCAMSPHDGKQSILMGQKPH